MSLGRPRKCPLLGDLPTGPLGQDDRQQLSDLAVRNLWLLGQDGGPSATVA